MNTANATFRFLRFGRPRHVGPAEDAADMGTCFGLEMSLEEPTPIGTNQIEPPGTTAWWERLSNRRRSQD